MNYEDLTVLVAGLVHVRQTESLLGREIQLNRSNRLLPPQRCAELDIDLRPVEGGFVHSLYVVNAEII